MRFRFGFVVRGFRILQQFRACGLVTVLRVLCTKPYEFPWMVSA